MSTDSTVYKSLVGKSRCKCNNSYHVNRYFKFLQNIINYDKQNLIETSEKRNNLSIEIQLLRKFIAPFDKQINKSTEEFSYYRRHKEYADRIMSVINECKKK